MAGRARGGVDWPGLAGPNIVTWHVRDLEGLWNGTIRALAKDGVVRER